MVSFSISRRAVWISLLAIFFGLVAWAVFEYQPSRQLHRVFERFVAAGERRDWQKVAEFLAVDYRDRWGHDRDSAVATASELLGHFFVLDIATEPLSIDLEGVRGTVRTRPRLSGNGTAVAQYVMARANELREEMTFVWHRGSWKPWDWKLVSVEQPEIAY